QAAIGLANQAQPIASSSATTLVSSGVPMLGLQKGVDKQTAAPGSTLTYTLTFQNTSQQIAQNVVITDQLPNGVAFQNAINSPQPALNGQSAQFNIGTVAPGVQGSISFTVTIQANVPNGTQLTNTATITANGV